MTSVALSPKEADAALCEAFHVVRLAHSDITLIYREIDGSFDREGFTCVGNRKSFGSLRLSLDEPHNFCSTNLSRSYIAKERKQIIEVAIDTSGESAVESFSVPYVRCALWGYKGNVKDPGNADGGSEEGYKPSRRASRVGGQKYVDYSYTRTEDTATAKDLIRYRAYVLRLLALKRDQLDEMIVSPLVDLARNPEVCDLGKRLAGKPFDGALIDCSDDELWAWFDQEE